MKAGSFDCLAQQHSNTLLKMMPQRDLMAEAEAANAQQGSKRPGAILTPTAKPKIARTPGDSSMSLQDLVTELDLVEMGEFDGVLT